MTDVDQFKFQVKYHQYLSTQQRVSDWVRGTGSQSLSARKPRTGSRYLSKSLPTRGSHLPTRGSKDVGCAASTAMARQRAGLPGSEPQTIVSPSIALILSALFVYIILPSLLTIWFFVLMLTYAGSLEADDSRDENTAEHHS
ncbi:hypothetical protein BYT27DRAFT_7263409 [Phlegmacium glaucopus]|nr:hypothetical protein BYT27DRAFT_7263409 [Phlegmacium glaucopus]